MVLERIFFLYTTFVTFATLNPFYTCLKENVRKMPKSFGMMSWSTAAYIVAVGV